MNRLKIGIRLESLGLPFRPALQQVAELGVGGVQFDAVGDLAPGTLSDTGRRQVRHLLRSFNLQLTALGCPLRRGLDVKEDQQPRLEHVKKVLSLAHDLGAPAVVVEPGRIPDDPESPRALVLSESLLVLGQHGDRVGSVLALETGLDPGAKLAEFLDRLEAIEYRGWLTIERESGDNRLADVTAAVGFLRRFLG
jgi:sugar phosphate isomerase/epimerase